MVAQRRGSPTSATPWWPSNPQNGGERAAFDLDDRDAQGRGMQRQLLEGSAPLGHHEQARGWGGGGEGLLDRTAAGDQLLVLGQTSGSAKARSGGGPPGAGARGQPRGQAGRAGAARPRSPGPPGSASRLAAAAGRPVADRGRPGRNRVRSAGRVVPA